MRFNTGNKFPVPSCSLYVAPSCLRLLPHLPVIYILPLYVSVNDVFQKAVPKQDVTNATSVTSVCCSSLTRSIEMVYSNLLQYHISKTFLVFLICSTECPSSSTVRNCSSFF